VTLEEKITKDNERKGIAPEGGEFFEVLVEGVAREEVGLLVVVRRQHQVQRQQLQRLRGAPSAAPRLSNTERIVK
jgi:hypothetical protein